MTTLPIIAEKHDAASAPIDAETGTVEITLVEGRTRVRSRRARLEDGKLQTEEFDGTLGGAAYARAIAETQHLLAEQTTFLLRQFSHLLRFWGK